ncbi:MAG TPA: pyridoxal-dependent decarboxylase [Steroidobacteraceae bacterium]|nr:pyridoxal-dependent decarboxylase [Steroidobacteraceae bacterium]
MNSSLPSTPVLSVSSQEFRELATRVVELAAQFYGRLEDLPAYPQTTGMQTLQAFGGPLPAAGMGAAALEALERVVQLSRPPGPRFFGYVLGSGEPVAALGDLLASVINQNLTAWRSAPAGVAIERIVVGWIAEAIGCPHLTGSLCGGGSTANLMALAMAREARLPANERGARPGTVYVSSEAHMSMAKAVGLLGLGRDNMRIVPVDERLRMQVGALEHLIEADRATGRELVAVVASAGTVSTGAIDPLQAIAAVCERHGLWMHVDGAYGAAAALACPEKFAGLERADSLSLDLHKWLYQPVDCGLLLFRDPARARAAFAYTGDYARVLEGESIEGLAIFEESLELSRRFRALKVWLSLRYHGVQAFREAIRADLDHAAQLSLRIGECPELELLAPTDLSAVCFRYRGDGGAQDLDRLNGAILKRVIDNGRVYLSNATVFGKVALRACFVNHRTRAADVAEIVSEVLQAGRAIAT